jgi:hypothetical protein
MKEVKQGPSFTRITNNMQGETNQPTSSANTVDELKEQQNKLNNSTSYTTTENCISPLNKLS